MTLKQLECFQAVHTYGSINKAAHALDVSAPAVATSIKRLKEDVDDPIWTDDNENRTLTPVGKLLLDYGNQILSLHGQLHNAIKLRDLPHNKKIHLAFLMGDEIPGKILTEFSQCHPEIAVHVEQCHSIRIHGGLQLGYVDIGITTDAFVDPEFESLPYLPGEFGVLISAASPLAQQDCIRPSDLSDLMLVVPAFDSAVELCLSAWCTTNNAEVQIHRSPGGIYSKSTLVFQKNTAAVFPMIDDALPEGMVLRKLDPPMLLKQSIFWSKKTVHNNERDILIKFLADSVTPAHTADGISI